MNADWITGAWLPMFVNVCLQATLILCLAMIAMATFQRRSAAFRHHIAATALAGLLLLPLLILIPTVKFALPANRHIPKASSYASDRQRTDSPQPPITIPSSGATIVAAPIHRDSLSTETATSDSARRPGREPIHVTNSQQALAFNPPPSLYVLLFAIWTIGVTLLLARFLVGSLRLAILARRCLRVTDATLCAGARSVERSVRIRQRITLIQYNALTPIAVPVTWGLWRPVILIPHDASNWSRERLHAVLLHEAAHIRRGDWVAQRLAQLACALFWFHPLAWYLECRMQHDAERACDDAVLASGIGATEYAGHLLDLVRAIRANNAPAAAVSMARDSQVSARLQAILDARPRTTSTRRALIAATVIAIAILGSTALLRPLAAQSTAPPAQGAGGAAQRKINRQDLQSLWVQSALTPATGPGVIITLKDSKHGKNRFRPDLDMIHDRDISEVVNSLKAAGAEAVSIGDQRLGAASVQRCVGPSVFVNNSKVGAPFLIRAIGNSEALANAVNAPGGVIATMRQTDPDMARVLTVPVLDVPGLTLRRIDRRWARTVPAAGTPITPQTANLIDLRGDAGMTDVAGPGVTVTLADSKSVVDGAAVTAKRRKYAPEVSSELRFGRSTALNSAKFKIQASDVLAVIDALRLADAEAISVGEQRVVSTTGIKAAGPDLLVNGMRVPWPIVVRSIGETDRLMAALKSANSGLDAIRRTDPAMLRIEKAATLRLSAYSGAAPKYVRPIQVGFQAPAPSGGPSGQKITLANGTDVELIAVGSSPFAGGDDWWRPDGVPLMEAPVRTNNRFHNSYWGVGTRFLSRSFFFRFSSPTDTTASTTGYVVDPEGKLASAGLHYGRDMRLNDTHLRSSEPATGTVLQGFPIHETRCTYRIGVATGPWETVGVIRFPLSPAPRVRGSVAGTRTYNPVISVNDTPAISYQDLQGKDHKQSLLGSHAPLGDVARRVIALDQFGREIPLDNEAIEYMELASSTVSRIAELRLETRPYQWAEFKDIELQPKRGSAPAPIATPAALPGFRHRFANGLTVSVLGVTERKKEGGRWWQPDGNRLAGPVKEFVSSLEIDQRLPNRPRAILLKLSSSRDITYSYAQRFSPEPTFGHGMVPTFGRGTVHITNDAGALKDQPIASWILVAYPPEIRSSTVSLGIASGAWQTVSSLPMPRDVRHKNVGPDSFDGDVTCSLGDRPSMTYDAQNGERRNITFLRSARALGDVARRIVGIDKTGTVVPLTTALSGNQETGDLIVLTFADSGALKRYNRFDLSTIKEFRLQTRPYEWAEFKGIQLEPQQ